MNDMWSNRFSFFLHLDSQYFKIVRNFYPLNPACSLAARCGWCGGDLNKP